MVRNHTITGIDSMVASIMTFLKEDTIRLMNKLSRMQNFTGKLTGLGKEPILSRVKTTVKLPSAMDGS